MIFDVFTGWAFIFANENNEGFSVFFTVHQGVLAKG